MGRLPLTYYAGLLYKKNSVTNPSFNKTFWFKLENGNRDICFCLDPLLLEEGGL
jgi:hypothetical protein